MASIKTKTIGSKLTIWMPHFRSKPNCRRAIRIILWEAHNCVEITTITAMAKTNKCTKKFIVHSTKFS